MKIVYTDLAKCSLIDNMKFLLNQGASAEKVLEIEQRIYDKVELLTHNPYLGQIEEYILGNTHRRIIEGNYKIIYVFRDNTIYITDIFDARQNPIKLGRNVE
jgi:plasmid stabilization system protein ParE